MALELNPSHGNSSPTGKELSLSVGDVALVDASGGNVNN